MFNSVYKFLIRNRTLHSIQDKLCFTQITRLSSKPISEISVQYPDSVNYLINNFGFSEEKAVNASKYLKVKSSKKPDLVVNFLEKRGLTSEQIGFIARYFPPILFTNPEKTLLPKIEFFVSLGISEDEVNNMFLTAPGIFRCSLKKQIMPTFSYIKNLFESSGSSFGTMKRLAAIFRCDLESQLIPNIEVLREAGVSDTKIVVLLQNQPRTLIVDAKRFREVVEEVKKMGFSPYKLNFLLALQAFRAMTKLTWDTKKECFKKWGWSDDDVISAFKTNPHCIMISTVKITALMNFLVNEMGMNSSYFVKRPDILSYSLKKRIKPRCSVYKILVQKDLIMESSYSTIFNLSEEKFLNRFVHPYEEEVPGLLQLYQKEMHVSES